MNAWAALRQRWSLLKDAFSTQLWPVPVISVVLAVAAGVGLTRLDDRIDDNLPTWLKIYLFGGSPDAARSLLGAVAGSLTTVTSLTFSLTVVTLQLASSQFSPRLLRTFTRDAFVQNTLALFLGTFAFALTVLRTVRGGSGGSGLVPQISVTVAFILAIASVLGLVLFLAHLVREIRVETMVHTVHIDATSTLQTMVPKRNRDDDIPPLPDVPDHAVDLLAAKSGFLTAVTSRDLLELLAELDAMMFVHRQIGSDLVAGTPVARVWSRQGELALSAEDRDKLQKCLDEALLVGPERTAAQDISYGLRQLTDVANKALSPGINDPTTAVHALGHSSTFLCEAARRQLGPRLLHDEDDTARMILAAERLPQLLELAVAQPRRYGAADPDVLARLFQLLRQVAWIVETDEETTAVREQLARLRGTVATQAFDGAELAMLQRSGELVDCALRGGWPTDEPTNMGFE